MTTKPIAKREILIFINSFLEDNDTGLVLTNLRDKTCMIYIQRVVIELLEDEDDEFVCWDPEAERRLKYLLEAIDRVNKK